MSIVHVRRYFLYVVFPYARAFRRDLYGSRELDRPKQPYVISSHVFLPTISTAAAAGIRNHVPLPPPPSQLGTQRVIRADKRAVFSVDLIPFPGTDSATAAHNS